MPKTIISDSSCLIILKKIDALYLLQKLYNTISITPDIFEEIGENLPEWVEVIDVKNKTKQQEFENFVDRGEASAMALALEHLNSLILLDDWKARQFANKIGLKISGTLGVLIKAKNEKYIKSIKPLLAKIKTTNFRISDELKRLALENAGEL